MRLKKFLKNKNLVVLFFVLLAVVVGYFSIKPMVTEYIKNNKTNIAIKSLNTANKLSSLLFLKDDEKKELDVVNQLVQEFSKKDDTTRTFLILLMNNMELRPGGGFLGQYAILKIKNGEVVSLFVEDANLLDQRITAKINPPYPFTRMIQLKKWKFRDSNFSPDFAVNADKAKYFYRLSGRSENFDGVVAVNASVFSDILKITGPITVPGYAGTYTSENAILQLEEVVEKKYILDPELDTQNRKMIMKKMAQVIMDKLMTAENLSKLPALMHKEMQNKNVMLNFKDEKLQKLVESVYWDGKVSVNWGSDYLMAVDANMGALKTDYYIKREMSYDIDLTQPKPVVNLNILYKNTATHGDWRTSDYHSYLRIYVPKGANLLEREMVSYPNIGEEFDKTYFGFILHVLINGQTNVRLKYELPETFDKENYRLLIQKQSGVGDVPVKIHVKTNEGEFSEEAVLNKDLKLEFKK